MNLIELDKNAQAVILHIEESEVTHKLVEYGFLPGRSVVMINHAPFGGPVYVQIDGNLISLRRREAKTIIIE